MRLKLDNLEVTKLGNKYYIPLSDIAMIVIEGNGTAITTKLLAALSKYNIALVICDDKYLPTGMFMSYGSYHRAAKRAQQQIAWQEDEKKQIWQVVVKQKITNQIAFANYKRVDTDRITLMNELNENVLS